MIKYVFSFILTLFMIITVYANDVTYIKFSNNKIAIGNNSIERTIAIGRQKAATTQIINKISNVIYKTISDEFALSVVFSGLGPAYSKLQNGENPVLLTSNDFLYQGFDTKELQDNGKELILRYTFTHDITAFILNVYYDVYPDNCFMEKRIGISDSSNGIQFLDKIYLESMSFELSDFSHGQFGQPVFNKDIFLGVEYPTAENKIESDNIMCGYTVGQKITRDTYNSHYSITGAASSSGNLEQTFMKYIDGVKIKGTRPYLLYNTWYDMRRPLLVKDSLSIMNEHNLIDRIHSFKKYLTGYNINLNAFVIDEGWDNFNSVWGVDSARFPNGFAPVANALDSMNISLGLWASPFGGYEYRDKRSGWAAKNGYETTGDFLCFAGKNYKAALEKAMTDFTRNFNIGYFKWDGFLLSCNEIDHGHLPGIYSREAFVSTYISMMDSVRKINPDIFLNITSGTWLSPWWLKYADCIWMQGADYAYAENVPSINDRDKAINYKDAVLYDDFQKQHLLFPVSSLMTHGIIKGRLNLLGGENESLESFSNEVMMYFGRGIMMWELYVSPDLLSDNEWNAIASAIKWAKENKEILKNTKMILGDPSKREIYGYIHLTKDKSILLLRNPSIKIREAKIKLNSDLGDIDPKTKYFVKIIYPYNLILPEPVSINQSLSIDMDGYEVIAAELIPAGKINKNLPAGVKYSIEDGNLVVYGAPGKKEIIKSVTKNKLADVQFDKKKEKIKYNESIPLKNNSTEFSSRVTINLPDQYDKIKFAFLLESDKALPDSLKPEFSIRVNGVSKQLTVEEGQGKWFWVTTILTPGEDIIDYSINYKAKPKCKINSWIMCDKELSGQKINGINIIENDILPAKPYAVNVDKEIVALKEYKIN